VRLPWSCGAPDQAEAEAAERETGEQACRSSTLTPQFAAALSVGRLAAQRSVRPSASVRCSVRLPLHCRRPSSHICNNFHRVIFPHAHARVRGPEIDADGVGRGRVGRHGGWGGRASGGSERAAVPVVGHSGRRWVDERAVGGRQFSTQWLLVSALVQRDGWESGWMDGGAATKQTEDRERAVGQARQPLRVHEPFAAKQTVSKRKQAKPGQH